MTCQDRILSNDYADVIIDYILYEDQITIPFSDYCYHNVEGQLGILHINRSMLPSMSIAERGYSFMPKCYGLMQLEGGGNQEPFDPLSLINSGIIQLQGEPLNLTGRGVVIGFIDTGIRYQNEVFRYSNGDSRILAIWDQTVQEGTPPEGFQYGTEYTREQIQEALNSDNLLSVVPSTDTNGHGTALASVAAGSRLDDGRRFTGAAPNSQIVMVKLKEAKQYLRDYYLVRDGAVCYQETDVLTAIQYLEKFAVSFKRPLVICIGIGTNLGAHDGNSPLSNYMNLIGERKGRVIVIAGGNEGNAAHHFSTTLSPSTPVQAIEIRVGEGEKGFVTELWGERPVQFSLSIKSPGGEIIPQIFPRQRTRQEFNFIFEKTLITMEFLLIEENSGDEFVSLRFENPTAGVWTVTIYTESNILKGKVNMWLPITEFLTSETYFLRPDPDTTMTVPSYTGTSVGISTYNDRNNSFYINSGRGFATNGRIKPDISSPGVDISTILGKRTGSSLAAAITAGGVAQLLQWAVIEANAVLVDSESIRNYLARGAARQGNISYPSVEWGFGRLDVAGVFNWLAGNSE